MWTPQTFRRWWDNLSEVSDADKYQSSITQISAHSSGGLSSGGQWGDNSGPCWKRKNVFNVVTTSARISVLCDGQEHSRLKTILVPTWALSDLAHTRGGMVQQVPRKGEIILGWCNVSCVCRGDTHRTRQQIETPVSLAHRSSKGMQVPDLCDSSWHSPLSSKVVDISPVPSVCAFISRPPFDERSLLSTDNTFSWLQKRMSSLTGAYNLSCLKPRIHNEGWRKEGERKGKSPQMTVEVEIVNGSLCLGHVEGRSQLFFRSFYPSW